MLPGHIVDEYLKAYREYIMREAEKSRKLKVLDQIQSEKPKITQEGPASFSSRGLWEKMRRQVSLWQGRHRRQAQPLRPVDALLSLFRPDPPCETC